MNAPPKHAVALAYHMGETAPRVVASGNGLIAEQIIARAREHGVFVHESKELVSLLMQVDLDREIPPALYRAVAELLAWLHHIESGGLARVLSDADPITMLFEDGAATATEPAP
ncbi:MAG: EscU/YscU/HrcU family type III secretion system export apparatus switch protein [Janthinobacterium lividum]